MQTEGSLLPRKPKGPSFDEATSLLHQSRYLLRIGAAMFLFTCLWGFVIPFTASRRVGLSVHTLSALQGVLLLAEGLVWPQLSLGKRTAGLAFWCTLHGTFAILGAYVLAALSGIGSDTLHLVGELPHGLSRGTVVQEILIKVLAYPSALSGLVSYALLLFGLCGDRPTIGARLLD